jgi:ABC-type multidrug transport system fused ATPase/permease subunit
MTSEEEQNRYKPGDALLILLSLLVPAMSLNQIIVSYQKINEGMAAAGRIFSIIDRVPLIESAPDAICPESF